MRSDILERVPSCYMQMYNTKHVKHVKLEEDLDCRKLSHQVVSAVHRDIVSSRERLQKHVSYRKIAECIARYK